MKAWFCGVLIVALLAAGVAAEAAVDKSERDLVNMKLARIMAASSPQKVTGVVEAIDLLFAARHRCERELHATRAPIGCFWVLKYETELGLITKAKSLELARTLESRCVGEVDAELPDDIGRPCLDSLRRSVVETRYRKSESDPKSVFMRRFSDR